MKEFKLSAAEIAQILHHVDATAPSTYVSIVGSMNADHVVEVEAMPKAGETIIGGPMAIHPGGKSANQASSCAHLHMHTHMLGAVGADANADFLLQALSKVGVDISGIEHVDGPTGSTIIVVDRSGENFIVVSSGANGRIDTDFVQRHHSVIAQSKILGLCLEAPRDVVQESARIAHEVGTTVVLNISPMPDDADKTAKQSLADAADIAIMNEHETAQWLSLDSEPTTESDWQAIDAQLAATGLQRVVVTLGAAGAVVLDDDNHAQSASLRIVYVPAFTVKPVDTTGAGDAFMGSMLACLASGNALASSCAVASAVSAYSTLGKGAQSSYGDAAQIIDFLA